jgi:hypothetical protein
MAQLWYTLAETFLGGCASKKSFQDNGNQKYLVLLMLKVWHKFLHLWYIQPPTPSQLLTGAE